MLGRCKNDAAVAPDGVQSLNTVPGGSEGSDNLVAADLRQGYRALPVITEEPASFLNGQKVRKK